MKNGLCLEVKKDSWPVTGRGMEIYSNYSMHDSPLENTVFYIVVARRRSTSARVRQLRHGGKGPSIPLQYTTPLTFLFPHVSGERSSS